MADLSAKNFGIAGVFIILLLLASFMLFGFLMYLAWHQENPWPTSTQPHSGRLYIPPARKHPSLAPAILFGETPIPPVTRRAAEL